MNSKTNLTTNGMSGLHFLFIFNSLLMIGVSLYLTSHFYEVLYPTKLGGAGSLCNISNFFNCDAATYSKLSNIAGVPISFFGVLIGALFLFASIMPSINIEKTCSSLSKINFIGCVALFIYSLVSLGSLCPFCTAYYALSGIAFYLLWKKGHDSWVPDFKVLGIWGALVLGGAFYMHKVTSEKESTNAKLNASIVEQFKSLADNGDPDKESAYRLHTSFEKFSDAPIRISVFSDFQCPFCKVVAEQMPELFRRYPGKINAQYMFYPLDSSCNSNIKGRMHAEACDAAAIAACDANKFLAVHDEIFANQSKLASGILPEIAKKFKLEGCSEKEEIKNAVIELINQGTKYNLKSTPTIIVNGKKIEGTIPNRQFFAIFDHLLETK